jgi:CcmD family protein
MLKRWWTAVVVMLGTGTIVMAQAPAAQDGFVPVNTLPPADQVPAGPLILTAYAFVWVAVLFYVWTVWRRLNKVESEMHTLERRSGGR